MTIGFVVVVGIVEVIPALVPILEYGLENGTDVAERILVTGFETLLPVTLEPAVPVTLEPAVPVTLEPAVPVTLEPAVPVTLLPVTLPD